MLSQPFLVTPSNSLAFQAVEACLRGDPEFGRVLVSGPRGSGKSSLLQWARSKQPADVDIRLEDPWTSNLSALRPEQRLIATLESGDPRFAERVAAFRREGGRVVSTVIEAELTEAVAREFAEELGLRIDDEALRLLIDKLVSPASVRGALQRLKAESEFAGLARVDALFAIRALGPFLFPSR